jgi:hypothetical protein
MNDLVAKVGSGNRFKGTLSYRLSLGYVPWELTGSLGRQKKL